MGDSLIPSHEMKDSESNNDKMSRRRFLTATGATSIAATAGCTGLPFGGKSEFQKELDKVRNTVKKYDGNPKKPIEDGYLPLGPYIPGMGWHLFNKKYAEKAAKNGFKITEPQIILFDSDGNLGAVEYGAPAQAVSGSPNLFSTENADVNEKWELHEAASHLFSNGDGEVQKPKNIPPEEQFNTQNWVEFRPVDEDVKPGDTYKGKWGSNPVDNEGIEVEEEERVVDFPVNHPDLVALHVWINTENPRGIFSPINPEFAQP